MNDADNRAYASAVLAVLEAEGAVEAAEPELRSVARAIDDNDELRAGLTDKQLPLGRRLSFVESEVLEAAHPATRTVLALLIAAERITSLVAILDAIAERVAEQRDRVVAEVTVAVEVDQSRRDALKAALERATGQTLDVRFAVDPEVVGGVRARVGDTVIDGSLLRRLTDLRTRVGL